MTTCTCDQLQLEIAELVGSPNPHSRKCPTTAVPETTSEAFALNDDAAITRALGMPTGGNN